METNNTENNTDRKKKLSSVVNAILAAVIVLLIAAILLFMFVITPMTVSGESMLPTLEDGSRVMVLKTGYTIERGDLIVFERPGSEVPPVKRVVGVAGDVIRFDVGENVYYVNGEPYTDFAPDGGYGSNYFAQSDAGVREALCSDGITVGENEYFVLGDNRAISKDSHEYGCIQADWLTGKVVLQY